MKITKEKIQTLITCAQMVLLAVIWWGDRTARLAVEDSVQTQQIISLNEKFDDWTINFDKRLDRIERKIDAN